MAREKGMGSLQQEKSGRWTARICVDGMKISRSTRTTDKAKAEAFLMRMLAPFGRGDRRLALADVWREYERSPRRRDLAASTMNAKRLVWMNYASWMEDNHPEVVQLKQVTPEVVAEYLRVLKIRHTATTYNNRVCVIREVSRVLYEQAGVMDDPWRNVRLLADDSHTRRELTVAELIRLLDSAKTEDELHKVKEWRRLFMIGIYTGLRLGDCCTLEWDSVRLDNDVIQVLPRKTRKHLHGVPVTIPLHSDLKAELEHAMNRKGDGETMECGRFIMPTMASWYIGGEHWRISRGLESIFARAKIKMSVRIEGRRTATPDATFHSLRHSFVSMAVNAGVPLAIVQSIVGHTSTAMTRHYYHENVEALRAAVAAIPSLAAGLSKRPNQKMSVNATEQFPEDAVDEMRKVYVMLKRLFG